MSQDNVNELISALLDGELAPDEQARVEELLLDSPEHRRTFKEMRALRDHIQSLPRYTLDGGFTTSVLQQVERRTRVPDARAGAKVDSEREPRQDAATLPAYRDSSDSPRGMKRGLAWAAVAIAASVMIFLIYGPLNQRPHREAADVRDPSSGNEPSDEAVQDESHLKDLDRAGLRQLSSKQFADSVEEDLERNANADDKLLPGSRQPRVSSAKAADANQLPEDFAAEKELAIQRLAAEAESTDQPGLLPPAGAFGGGAADSGTLDLYYVVDIPCDTAVSEVVDATLVQNGIAMVESQDQLAALRRSVRKGKTESTVGRFAGVDNRDSARELSLSNNEESDLKRNLNECDGTEFLVVNATQQQINDTLATLKSRGYQWEARPSLGDVAETLFDRKAQAGREAQLSIPRGAASASDEEQSDAKADSRAYGVGDANIDAPQDAPDAESPLEEAKQKLPRAPQPIERAGSAASNRAANGPLAEKPSDIKNEVGKVTEPASKTTPRSSFAKSAEDKTNNLRQQLSGSHAYWLKAPATETYDSIVAEKKKEEAPTVPSSPGTGSPDSAVRDSANKSTSQPHPDAGGEGESGQAVDGLDVANGKEVGTKSLPLVRTILILRLMPPAPKDDVPRPTP